MADTADLEELRKLYSFFPLEGVTTNPTILLHSGYKLSVAIEGIQELVGTGMVHVQMISGESGRHGARSQKIPQLFRFWR